MIMKVWNREKEEKNSKAERVIDRMTEVGEERNENVFDFLYNPFLAQWL